MARAGAGSKKRRVGQPSSTAAEPRRRGRPKGEGSQIVYTSLRQRILDLQLPPGANLDELAIVNELGVSRTPVREALIRLASEGLVTIAPGQGAHVTLLDISDVPQMIEAVELFQRVINRWSAIRRRPEDLAEIERWSRTFAAAASRHDAKSMSEANRQFHIAIAKGCRNKYLCDYYEALSSSSLRLARLTYADDPTGDRHAEIVRQHEAMIDAIRRQDPDAADQLAKRHAEISRTIIREYIETSLAKDSPLGGVPAPADL